MNYRTLLSRHRSALMGIAALLITLIHGSWTDAPLHLWRFMRHGNAGVDVFVFLSGFGLVRALGKQPPYGAYMARRMRRILPVYYVGKLLLIALDFGLWAMGRRSGILPFTLRNLMPVSVWLNDSTGYWYVSAAIVYYALAPLVYAWLTRARHPRLVTALLLATTAVWIPAVSRMTNVDIAIMRLPALVLGLAVGAAAQREGDDCPARRWAASLALVGLVGLCSFGLYAGQRLPVLNLIDADWIVRLCIDLLMPILTVAGAYALEGLSRTPLRAVNRVLERIGAYSLEFYIAHMLIRLVCWDYLRLSKPVTLLLMLALSYPAALGVRRAGALLLSGWQRVTARL